MRTDVPFTYRPIDVWPGEPTKHRVRSRFDSGWGRTLDLLNRELAALNARHVVCQIALEARDFRVTDGHPRASARTAHPGVILAFESKHGPLKYACDTYDSWDDNIRAIALGLEALRKVERYGITKRGEQYKGWSALPPGTVMGETMTKAEAARVLADLSGLDDVAAAGLIGNADMIQRAFRLASKRAHPDHGGTDAMMTAAVNARRVLLGE